MSTPDMVTTVRLTPTLQDAAALRCTPSDTAWPDAAAEIYERQGVSRAATWEGSVLPALRAALDQRHALRGAKVTMERDHGHTYEVRTTGAGWSRTDEIRRDTMEHVQWDVRGHVLMAADAAKADVPPTPCPVCAVQIVPGVKCEACREAAGKAADTAKSLEQMRAGMKTLGDLPFASREVETMPLQPAEPARRADERTPLPEGWTWDDRCILPRAVSGACEWALVGTLTESEDGEDHGLIVTHNNLPAPPAVHNALVREAARLGLVCHEEPVPEPADLPPSPVLRAGMSPAAREAQMRNALMDIPMLRERPPEGYGFEHQGDRVGVRLPIACGARGRVWVYANGSHGEYLDAPEHAAALAWARAMLGSTQPTEPPEGYWFTVDRDGDVSVRRADGAWMQSRCVDQVYYCRDSAYCARSGIPGHERNTDPRRWAGHEAARQWAAHLLGETAPPLRTIPG